MSETNKEAFSRMGLMFGAPQEKKEEPVQPVAQIQKEVKPVEYVETPEKKFEKRLEPGRKSYPYANGRKKVQFNGMLFEDQKRYCRDMGEKMGFSSGAINHYICYLIDKEMGHIK